LAALRALRIPRAPEHFDHAYYRLYAFIRPERLLPGWNRELILEKILAQGIPCNTGSCSEVYLEKAFPAKMRPRQRLPIARELGETSLAFQVHPTLETRHLERTCQVVEDVMRRATRAEVSHREEKLELAGIRVTKCEA